MSGTGVVGSVGDGSDVDGGIVDGGIVDGGVVDGGVDDGAHFEELYNLLRVSRETPR